MAAQPQSPSYWQYRASGRLQHTINADFNQDGVDEFIVVDENGKVDLLDAQGVLQQSYIAPEPVLAIQLVDTADPVQSEMEIVLGLRNRLILISTTGREIWQIPLTPVAAPADLLTSGSRETEAAWMGQYEAVPLSIASIDHDGDGRDEILVLLDSGQLVLFDAAGNLIWRYVRNSNPILKTQPQMVVGDFDQNGLAEIALGFFNPHLRFSQLALIDDNGRLLWDHEQPISGRLTALTAATLAGKPTIAIGTNLGHVYVYDGLRQRLWFRTVNKPVTKLITVPFATGSGLAVGTDAGSIIIYDWQGRRQWTRHLVSSADRSVVGLSAAPFNPPDNQPALAAVIGTPGNRSDPADVILLASNGRTLDTLSAVDAAAMARLADINGDKQEELLLGRFANLELRGFSIGASELASDWEYGLLGLPRSMLVVDLDQDGADEILVGTENGRIHSLKNDGSYAWVANPGVAITHMAPLPDPPNNTTDIVVVRNKATPQPNNNLLFESWVALRRANGEQIWEKYFPTPISTLQVEDTDDEDRPEVIVGTGDGRVIAYNSSGDELWQTVLPERVEQILVLRDGSAQFPYLIAATTHRLYLVRPHAAPWIMAWYPKPIQQVYPFGQQGGNIAGLIIFVAENQAYGITLQGRQLPHWPFTIDGPPIQSQVAQEPFIADPLPKNTADSFLITTAEGHLRQIVVDEGQPRLSWLLTGLGNITSLYWGDLDNDGVSDMALGDQNGRVLLYDAGLNPRRPELFDRLNLGSRLFALTVLQRENSQKSDLLAITQNGVVQLFRVQENQPPLLTNPEVEAVQGRYSLIISVNDAEQDEVVVRLEIYNPAAQQWESQGDQRLVNGRDKLFWLVDNPPAGEDGVHYRFLYDDGLHQGEITPPPGPVPTLVTPLANSSQLGFIILGGIGLILSFIFLHQSQSSTAQARRFYHTLSQEPSSTLIRLETKYRHSDDLPDFLLSLANWARQREDELIASLVNGLFLLINQPSAGLPIIINTLHEARLYSHPTWQCMERWEQLFKVSQAFLEAPSVTELCLLRPQLLQLLALMEETDHWSPAMDSLQPILSNLRDSKRVELAEDSLVYLNKAAVLLDERREELPGFPDGVERPLVEAIIERWKGLVNAEIQDLRGRADLAVTLKTKRLAPIDQTDVVLEIRNTGRAAAENIIAELADNPAFICNGRPQVIPLLPPGHTRQVSFQIEPRVKDQFRLVLNLTYDDRNQRDKAFAFGDMVHLLPPAREFRPIANPYLPGTPLRRDSTIFFGREELFDFVAENASRLSQHNVLILVGQRRTGKTSLLLRLEQYLPANLLPIYIDCQSLGISPGMPALLHDLAWYIADTVAARGFHVDVPEPEAWQEDPTRFFQRHFLPQVQSLLPEDTTLLFVFDEFEVFENLVQDGILPSTLFPYMRHLMQHSTGLSFIFVGTRRLEEMSADYWSVLFNIALYRKIDYLEEEIARRLIQEPVSPNLVYDDLALDKIWRVTAGHPYFLQLVCYTLVKQANVKRKSYVTILDVNTALDEMLSLGEVHFAYLWQRSTQAERALLTAVSQMMDRDRSFHPTDMVQYLAEYGIHLKPAEVTAALRQLVERDILQEVTKGATSRYELKIGLVGLWVAKQKSLSQLYNRNGKQVSSSIRA